ncbi:MAG: RNA ligase family protein [Myxococcota bacterium]
MSTIHKYPRTPHLQGSRLQPGDEDLEAVPFRALEGRHLVVEEKLDGANVGVGFNAQGQLVLQSRGHFLGGGGRERQFDLLKTWATVHQARLFQVLGSRHLMYGEWLYAKHTVFYDELPHYFLEFDVLDKETGTFLSTPARRALLRGVPVTSVPVLHEGTVRSEKALRALVGRSRFKSARWREVLDQRAREHGLTVERVRRETDISDEMEGLYLKVEEDGVVRGRYKHVRRDFLTAIVDGGSHWSTRPILPNALARGVDILG